MSAPALPTALVKNLCQVN